MPKVSTYTSELKKFITSQYIYAGVRMAFAVVVPSIILAYFGLLKEYFLFPLGTVLSGFTDTSGPFIRRRNILILVVVCFFFSALAATFLKDYPPLIFVGLVLMGMFFTMLGVYGQRMAGVGGFTLVVFSIFIDGQLSGDFPIKSVFIFTMGSIWFLLVFMASLKLQPYKLIEQMIGENFLQLASYFRIKAQFYAKNPNYDIIDKELILKQIDVKNLQENTREVVFKTRTIVNESTTTSRLMMLLFLNSVDLFDKMVTGVNYKKIQENFGNQLILEKIYDFIYLLSEELSKIGIALQSGQKNVVEGEVKSHFEALYQEYFELRSREMSSENLEDFMNLRFVLLRITEVTNEIQTIYKIYNQDLKSIKSISTGLDFKKFVPKQEKLNLKVFLSNFSFRSTHFLHSIRITIALLLGYAISKSAFLEIGHSYWILITILAIMRPAYSITKYRNRLRIYGTISGALVAYFILIGIKNEQILLGLLLVSMILCFALLTKKYSWAVFFMTIYIFIGFNFLHPNSINIIFKDRIIDTFIAGVISFGVSYFVFPIWEHSKSLDFMRKSAQANLIYFEEIMDNFFQKCSYSVDFKMNRKNTIINLANLSDNFQRMISEPKNQQERLEILHQFVITSHIITAYLASLAQYIHSDKVFEEIDWASWKLKISAELRQTVYLLSDEISGKQNEPSEDIIPKDRIENLISIRKLEIEERVNFDIRDKEYIPKLTELKNLKEILELLYDVSYEQRKVVQKYKQEGKK